MANGMIILITSIEKKILFWLGKEKKYLVWLQLKKNKNVSNCIKKKFRSVQKTITPPSS
jgi:hypothetical protein